MPIKRGKSSKRITSMKRPLKGHRHGRWTKSVAKMSTAKPKGFINQAIYNKSAVPGSMAYRPKDILVQKGMKFSNSFPKNDVDWKILAASSIPGPGAYKATPIKKTKFVVGHSGKFNNSMPASDVDIAMRRSAQEPGPLEYCTSFNKKGNKGVRFSNAFPKNDVDWKIYTASFIPGPGKYVQDVVSRERKSSTGQFSKSNVPGFIKVALNHYGSNPSPVEYQHHNYDRSIRESYGSSKMSSAFPKSDVDWSIYRASTIPGPGHYHPSHTFKSDVIKRNTPSSYGYGIEYQSKNLSDSRTLTTSNLKCYDGNIKVRNDIIELFKNCGVQRLIRSIQKNQMNHVISIVNMYPLPVEIKSKLQCKKHLEIILHRYQNKYGKTDTKCISMIKLISTMLKHDGQIERAINIMKTAV